MATKKQTSVTVKCFKCKITYLLGWQQRNRPASRSNVVKVKCLPSEVVTKKQTSVTITTLSSDQTGTADGESRISLLTNCEYISSYDFIWSLKCHDTRRASEQQCGSRWFGCCYRWYLFKRIVPCNNQLTNWRRVYRLARQNIYVIRNTLEMPSGRVTIVQSYSRMSTIYIAN